MVKEFESLEHYVKYFAKSNKFDTVIDIGCGTRPYEKYFSNCKYIGLDVESSGRNKENKNANIYFDGINLPFPNESIDGVLITQVLEHAAEPNLLFQEIKRVLKPDGKVCMTVPFIWAEHEAPFDFRRFTSFGMAQFVESHGFEVRNHAKICSGTAAIRRLVESEVTKDLCKNRVQPARLVERFYMLLIAIFFRLLGPKINAESVFLDNAVWAVKKR